MLQLGCFLLGLVTGILVSLLLRRTQRPVQTFSIEVERDRTEANLKASKVFLNQIINVISDTIFVKDEQHRFVLVNQALCDLIGLPQEAFLGRTDYDLFPQTQADHFRQKDHHVFQTGLEDVTEEPLTTSTGETRWLLTKKTCFHNPHGQKFLVGSSRDITVHKQIEADLQQQTLQEQAFSRIVQIIRNSLDQDVIFSAATREFAELLQLDLASIAQYVPERRRWIPIVEHIRKPGALSLLGVEIPDDNNPMTQRLKRREVVLIENTHTLVDPVNQAIAQLHDPIAWLNVPLEVNGTVWGCLVGIKSPLPATFTEYEIHLVQRFADQLAIAIQQASLYQQVQQLNQKLEQRVRDRTAALQESEEKFRQLAENINHVFCLEDIEGQLLYTSPSYEKIWGQSVEALYQHPNAWFDTVHPEDRDRVIAQQADIQKRFEGKIEYRIIRPDGDLRWLCERAFPIHNAQGEIYRIAELVEDITDRKTAEAALQISEQNLRTIFNNVNHQIWVHDVDGTIFDVNDRVLEHFALEREQLLQLSLLDLNLPATHDFLQSHWQRAITGEGEKAHYEWSVPQHDDGSKIIALDITLNRIIWGGKAVILACVQDITERKQAEAEIRRSKDLFEAMFEESADAIFLVDVVTRLSLTCNQRAVELFEAKNQNELIGIRGPAILHKHSFTAAEMAAVQTALEVQGVWQGEVEYLTRQGNIFWGSVACKQIQVAGEPMILVRVTDISDRKCTEAERQQAAAALRQSEARFQHLAANIPGIFYQSLIRADGLRQFHYVSSGCQRLFELEPAQLLEDATLFWTIVHPDDVEPLRAEVTRTLMTQEPFQFEYRIIPSSGRIQWIHNAASREYLANGDIVSDGVVLDITERKAAAAALQISEQNLRTIFNNVSCQIWVHDADGNVFDVNDRVLEDFALEREQLLQRSLFDISPPAAHDFLQSHWQRVIAEEGGKVRFELHIPKPGDITDIHLDITLNRIMWGGKAVILACMQDVSDRKRAEVEIRRSKDLFEAIFQESMDAILLCNLGSSIVLNCNQRAVELFEADSKDDLLKIEGHTLRRVPRSPQDFAETWEALQRQESFKQETEYRTFKDRTFWGNFALKPIQVAEQQMVLVQITDVTERKQAALHLQRQAEADQLLAAIVQTISQSIHLDEVLEICLEEIRQFLQCDRVVVCRFDADYSIVIEREAVSQSEFSLLGRTMEDPCFGQAGAEKYQQGYTTVRGDTQAEDMTACYAEFLAQIQVQANLVVGILQANQIWGLLIAHHCHAPRQWQSFEVDLFKRLAMQIGIAGQKSALYVQLAGELTIRRRAEQALAQQVQREKVLRTLSQQIRQSLRLDQILATTVIEVRQLLEADRAVIFRLDGDRSGIVIQESLLDRHLPTVEMYLADQHFPQESYDFYLQGRARTVNWTDIDTLTNSACLAEFMEQIGVKSKIVAPILQTLEDNTPSVWGLLIVHACTHYRQWQPVEVELLQQLATQVGIAIQQAALYSRIENQLAQKEVLFKEVHHRVKNNLQVISSMLWLQTEATNHPAVSTALADTRNRLQAMSLIHETLYQHGDLGRINFHDYIRRLTNSVLAVYATRPNQITLRFHLQSVAFNLETAIPCGLLLNELITNAMKHGFPDGRNGEVCITLEHAVHPEPELPDSTASASQDSASQDSALQNLPLPKTLHQARFHYILTIEDNGVGIPETLHLKKLKSLGLKIAYDLALQLEGNLELERTHGTRFCLTFSALEYGKRF